MVGSRTKEGFYLGGSIFRRGRIVIDVRRVVHMRLCLDTPFTSKLWLVAIG